MFEFHAFITMITVSFNTTINAKIIYILIYYKNESRKEKINRGKKG